jgi:hypothetical protein
LEFVGISGRLEKPPELLQAIVPARTAGVANRVRQDCNIRCKLRCNHKVVFTLFVGTPAQPSPGWVTACHRDTVETFEVRAASALKGTTFRSLVSSVASALKGTSFSSSADYRR